MDTGVVAMASVFVIDDNLSACFAIANLLTREGFAVRTAHSGRDALAVIAQERPDLVVCDLRLPDIDGLEVSSAVADRWRDHAPVVLVSGIVNDEICQAAAHAGAAAVFQKPFDVPAFLDTVRRLLVCPPRKSGAEADGWLSTRQERALVRLLDWLPRVRGLVAVTRCRETVFAHGDIASGTEAAAVLASLAKVAERAVGAGGLGAAFQVTVTASGGRLVLDLAGDPMLAVELEGHDMLAESRARSLLTNLRTRLAS